MPRVVGSRMGRRGKNSTFFWNIGPTDLQAVNQRQFPTKTEIVKMHRKLSESGRRVALIHLFFLLESAA